MEVTTEYTEYTEIRENHFLFHRLTEASFVDHEYFFRVFRVFCGELRLNDSGLGHGGGHRGGVFPDQC